MCNEKHPHRQKEMVQRLKSRNEQGMRRVNYIEETEDEESDVDEEQLVLKIEGKGRKPFYMESLMCGNYFKAIIDTRSPVSIFTEKDLQKIVGERKVVIRKMIENERYVDYNKKPLELLGYQFVRLEVAGVTVSKAKVLVAPNSGKSIVGRDWLVALRYRINQPMERDECEGIDKNVNCVHHVNEVKNVNWFNSVNEAESEGQLDPEIKQLMGDFLKLFTRKVV